MSDYLLLPPEIWSQILTKLPVKSILRCRCVCKTWYSLISSPHFISAQTLNHSTSNRVLVRRMEPTVLHKFSSHDESFVESHEHDDLPERFMGADFVFVGSCNGLFCFCNSESFLIWNPSIRKLVEHPFPSSSADAMYVLGFGFASSSGDYKVLRVGYEKSCVSDDRFRNMALSEFEIFYLTKSVWRSLRMRPYPISEQYCLCVYFNGALHWIGNEFRSDCTLLSFNLSNEVFLEMGMPDCFEFRGYECDQRIAVCGIGESA